MKDRGKYTLGETSRYVDSQGYSYHATTKPMLDVLLRELFTRKPLVRRVVYR